MKQNFKIIIPNVDCIYYFFPLNPLNAKLNPIYHLLASLGAQLTIFSTLAG